jgi:hypothetical protein
MESDDTFTGLKVMQIALRRAQHAILPPAPCAKEAYT